ncbi:MAG: TM2 domain-containing protein [Bacteroidota bacterium]|nr:TM2 domain-containing protein [Bacteroidota bacterium]
MKKIPVIVLLFIFCGIAEMRGAYVEKRSSVFAADTNQVDTLKNEKAPEHKKFFPKKENKKLIASILAFPVPFGFLGLHRIYLGTEPWVPVVYLVTAGGGMILPLIDFIAIICADKEELKKYENNAKLIMWVE